VRIAYGVHGYGRGHSSRALAVLPELTARHDVLILAGGDAFEALQDDYPVTRIPVFRYALKPDGTRSKLGTLRMAVPNLLDLRLNGPALQTVQDHLAAFRPDVVVTDSEAWTHWACRRMKLPRISFDHFGVLVYCRWPMGPADRLVSRGEAMVYRRLMAGGGDRHVIVSFHAAPPRAAGVQVVGPVLRRVVREQTPTTGDYLLVYFSNGQAYYTPRVMEALRAVRAPVVVYGAGRAGREGNIEFRPPSNVRFVEDLAAARAVFATAGNQLISEAMHLRKAMLLIPQDCLEQRLNAAAIEKMHIGMRASVHSVSAGRIEAFLSRRERFEESYPPPQADGRERSVRAIEQYARELAGK